ncbi:hypothetical protein H7F51_06450 [Novosphingobium flavum]|uniref:Glycosyltransferase RgtA/B/C/D-like domain-containing protein n=1 Tax=Novosphingobium flavum TaxID=1778672 RepID=A0A7X1FRR3_9SPHN|nr:hypothetical protein [Novosphingobium flavum]MBC2665152.1 hypothetical protein [Novosphingobium flavum]
MIGASRPVPARSWPALALAAAGLLTLVYAAASLALPFGWDHGIIASVGSSYVHGGLPYVDSWDMKGPAAYLPFSLAEFLFGPTMWGIRLVDLAFWSIAGFVIFARVGALTTRPIGAWAALATYLWIASAGWFFTAAPESWVTTSLIVAFTPLLAAERTAARTCAMAGFFIACAGLVKPFYFTFGLIPLAVCALAPGAGWKHRAALASALALGAAIPPALIGGYFALRGGLPQLIEVHLLYPLTTYLDAASGWNVAMHGVAASLLRTPVICAALLALGTLPNWRAQWRPLAILAAWFAIALFCVVIQKKYYTYHWFPAYPPLFIAAALGLHALSSGRSGHRLYPAAALALAGIALVATAARPLRDAGRLAWYRLAERAPDRYYAAYSFRLYDSADEMAAARYIAAHTAPQDGVYVWGSDATVAYLADRPDPARFTFAMPLAMPGQYRAAYRDQAARQLALHPPVYFVSGISWDGLARASDSLADFPWMAGFLARNYRLEKSFGVIDLYRLKDRPRP